MWHAEHTCINTHAYTDESVFSVNRHDAIKRKKTGCCCFCKGPICLLCWWMSPCEHRDSTVSWQPHREVEMVGVKLHLIPTTQGGVGKQGASWCATTRTCWPESFRQLHCFGVEEGSTLLTEPLYTESGVALYTAVLRNRNYFASADTG